MTTQPQTKYPGADTSKERLSRLQALYTYRNTHGVYLNREETIRDLLAMIEERDAMIAQSKILIEQKLLLYAHGCPTCNSMGFAISKLPKQCEYCDGTFGGNPPK